MQVTEVSSDGLMREYTVQVDAVDIGRRLDAKIQAISHQVRMPGFRPGKVPVSLVKKLHGKSVMGEVLEETVKESSQRVLQDNELRPAVQPKIEVIKFDEGSDLEYKLTVEILPDFELPDYSKISLERLTSKVKDERVGELIEVLAESQKAFASAPEGHKACRGDAVVIDYVGKVGGEAFEGGSAENHQLELGSGIFSPVFEEKLEGVEIGDEKEIAVTFPADYQAAQLAGREASFSVTVRDVRQSQTVEVGDELAQRLGLENLDALKKAVREQAEKEHAQATRAHLKRSLLDSLEDQYDFKIPDTMVDQEFDQIWQQLLLEVSAQDMELSDLEESEEEMRADYRAIAERRVRLGLVLAETGRVNEIKVAQEDINERLSLEARQHPGREREILEYYQNNPEALAMLQSPLFEEKVVDFILELANIKDREVTAEELLKQPDEIEKPKRSEKAAAKSGTKKKASGAKKAPAKGETKSRGAGGAKGKKAKAGKAS